MVSGPFWSRAFGFVLLPTWWLEYCPRLLLRCWNGPSGRFSLARIACGHCRGFTGRSGQALPWQLCCAWLQRELSLRQFRCPKGGRLLGAFGDFGAWLSPQVEEDGAPRKIVLFLLLFVLTLFGDLFLRFRCGLPRGEGFAQEVGKACFPLTLAADGLSLLRLRARQQINNGY